MEEEEEIEILPDDDDASVKEFALNFVVDIINYAITFLSNQEEKKLEKDFEVGGESEDSGEESEEEYSEEEDEEDTEDDDEDNEVDLYGRWSMVDTTGWSDWGRKGIDA